MDKYTTFGRRAGASILDSIILVPVYWGVAFAVMKIIGSPNMISWSIPSFISVFYYISMHYFWGQTLGKMAARVKVLSNSGEMPINLGQSIARSLPQLILPMFAVSFSTSADTFAVGEAATSIYLITFVFSIINIVACLISARHRALHDFISGTVVVKTDV